MLAPHKEMLLERQNTFRPVFKEHMSSNWINRQHASRLRRKLVENNLDYDKIKSAFESGGKKSIEEILKKISTFNEKEYDELLEILDCYFDPEKKPVAPKQWPGKGAKQKDNKQEKKLNSSSEASPDNAASPRSENIVVVQ